jgi:hypothetical protein
MLWTIFFMTLFCLLPGVIVGRNLLAYYQDYLHSFLGPRLASVANDDELMFFSFHGMISYILPAAKSWYWAKLAGWAAALAAMLAVDVTARKSPAPQRDVWSFCAYLLGGLFVSPMAESHHLTLAIPAVFLLGVKTFFDRRWRTGPVLALVGVFLVCFDVLPQFDKASPAYFASLIVLLILLVLAAVQGPEKETHVQVSEGIAT